MKEKVYIFGHRNPDTDSVAGAIALSHLKRQLGMDAIPAVLSSVNEESKYALNYFKIKEPIFLNDVKIKIKDLNYTKNYSVLETDSINDAYYKMEEAAISKIPVVDKNKKLLGIITMNDIAKQQFSNDIDKVDSSYDNIMKSIHGKELLKFDEEITGNLIIASYKSTTILSSVPISRENIMMVGDRHSVIEYAIYNKVKLLIITGDNEIHPEHLELAKKNRVNIIITPQSTVIASRKINLANSIRTINYKKEILCVHEQEAVSDFVKMANRTRYSYYPVLNKKDECIGILRISDVNYDNKQNVILVDHNTYEQSAIGIEETNILEIIDHHNIGTIGTNMPINFRNMPVGSSNTIIYLLYHENNVGIPSDIAGMMLSGILSDTLILNSPTTTEYDRKAVKDLAQIARVDYETYGLSMLKAGSSLKGKTKEEILYTDYKNYPVGDNRIGLGQLSTTNPNEILDEKEEYIELLNNVAEGNNYYLVALFITDILKRGSYVLYSSRAEEVLRKAFKNPNLTQGTFLKGIISRKQQILPGIMIEIEE